MPMSAWKKKKKEHIASSDLFQLFLSALINLLFASPNIWKYPSKAQEGPVSQRGSGKQIPSATMEGEQRTSGHSPSLPLLSALSQSGAISMLQLANTLFNVEAETQVPAQGN